MLKKLKAEENQVLLKDPLLFLHYIYNFNAEIPLKKVSDSNLHRDIIKRGKYFALAVKKHLPQIHVIRLRLHQYRL